MYKIKNIIAKSVLIGFIVFTMSGCSTMMEGIQSQMEVPTLEKQANRVAIGMTIVRENNIMAYKMPISSDATWPDLIAADISDLDEIFIVSSLMNDPYFATFHYTEMIQRKMLGSTTSVNMLGEYGSLVAMTLDQPIKPLTKRAIQKIMILYGKNKANWPNIYQFGNSKDSFLDFKDGKLKEVEALSGDIYATIGEAIISLTPINMQKDLSLAREEMLEWFEEVASLKLEKGELQTKSKSAKNRELVLINTRISEAEKSADEKETIYFQILDQAIVALESDINIDDENYVKLAKKLNTVSSEIQVGANQAYSSFGLAMINIRANDILRKLPKELKSLAAATIRVPVHLRSKYQQRISRVMKNSVYLLPNILIGTYYAYKQSSIAQKYEDFTSIILLAYEAKIEQEKAAKEDVEENIEDK
jgi:hypothetical protein